MYFIYYVGGPSDLTKKAIPALPKYDTERVLESVSLDRIKEHTYYLHRLYDKVFVAIHEDLLKA